MATPSRLETLDTLRTANRDVAFANAFVTLFGGSLMVGFIKHLGGNDFWIGLYGSIPALMGLAQIPGAALGRGQASFKKYVRKGGLAWRLLYFPLILLPLIALPNDIRLFLLIALLGLAGFATNLVGPTYTEWIGRIVPERSRGWYFSQRTMIATIVGMIVGLIGARLLDYYKGIENESVGFALIFGLGWLCAMISQYFYERMADSTRDDIIKPSLKSTVEVVKQPLRDPNFRQIMWFIVIFTASQGFAGNLFAAFALESLKMDFLPLQLTGVAHALGTIVSVRMWGFLADRYGNKPLLLLLSIGVSFTPLVWIACPPGEEYLVRNTIVLFLGHIFNGFVWSGVGVVQMNLYLSTSTPENRANYLASALTIASLALAISPLFGSAMLSALRIPFAADHAYKIVFLTVTLMRIIAVFVLRPVKEHGSTDFSETMRQLTKITPRSVAALRAMRRGTNEQTRESAIRSMGQSQMSLASNELEMALVDPAPKIRREASRALGHLRSETAAAALVNHITNHPELVEEETLEALGDCGQALAAEILTQYLTDPRSQLRRAAAKALGRLQDPQSIGALRNVVNQPGDPDLRRAALQALRNLEATDPELYADALLDQHPSVRIAAAEAISELHITELAPNLRHSLEWFQDEGASEVAYSLGSVGVASDLPYILQAANQAVGQTKIRRCLLGAAKLFGLDTDYYRLIALDEVSRDTELLKKYRNISRKDKHFSAALSAYSSGEESQALVHLSEADPNNFTAWAEYSVPESFLVAAHLYSKLHERH